VVGGDDLTVVCDGRLALSLTEHYLIAFAELAGAHATVRAALEAVNGADDAGRSVSTLPDPSAAAGIAFVKPHHPFSDAYSLAEELCASAKELARSSPGISALDFHVLYDSVGRDVDEIRGRQRVAASDGGGRLTRLWSGPIAVGDTSSVTAQVLPDMATLRAAVAEFARRDDGDDPASVSRSSAHALRSALVAGGAGITLARQRAELRARNSRQAREVLAQFLEVDAPETGRADHLSYLLDALALSEVQRGLS
jgi:hypothetical protein